MDKLEKFILENRDTFDDAVPSLKVWAEIDRSLGQRSARRIKLWRVASIAASVAVLLLIGALAGSRFFPANNPQTASLGEIAPEYAEMEEYYQTQVNYKMEQLATYQKADAVQPDLKQLDALFEELRKELETAPKGSEEHIINAMIETYKTRLQILERVLNKVQSTNPKTLKPEDDETSI